MKILVTGAAGFIGMHQSLELIKLGHKVIGLDNLNDYYSPQLKVDRLMQLGILEKDIPHNTKIYGRENFEFIRLDITNDSDLKKLFKQEGFDVVINLAAQAGVRHSIQHPDDYISSNIIGFFNILEACRAFPVKHLVYASSSSVYGNSSEIPFSTEQKTDEPVSLYAATKKSNELMAHSYAVLYGIPSTGLRFFTVYGPWGRPDMAYFHFTSSILKEKTINLYANGELKRDFTYIDDITESIAALINYPPMNSGIGTHRVLNIGNSSPVVVNTFVTILEKLIGKQAQKTNFPMQLGDVNQTFADTKPIEKLIGFKPNTPLESGLRKFVAWFKDYYT